MNPALATTTILFLLLGTYKLQEVMERPEKWLVLSLFLSSYTKQSSATIMSTGAQRWIVSEECAVASVDILLAIPAQSIYISQY